LQEKQFVLFFGRAVKKRGVTGEILLQMLELRLDNIAFRLGFAPSRRAARQFVRHSHLLVNDKKANIPSMVLEQGDVIRVRDQEKGKESAKQSLETAEGRGSVSWLSLDKEKLSGEILHVPSRDEIAPTINEQLIVELYSK
jgi:small subunit ribosomal protein S4